MRVCRQGVGKKQEGSLGIKRLRKTKATTRKRKEEARNTGDPPTA